MPCKSKILWQAPTPMITDTHRWSAKLIKKGIFKKGFWNNYHGKTQVAVILFLPLCFEETYFFLHEYFIFQIVTWSVIFKDCIAPIISGMSVSVSTSARVSVSMSDGVPFSTFCWMSFPLLIFFPFPQLVHPFSLSWTPFFTLHKLVQKGFFYWKKLS